jgi:hypothetical protein
MTRRPIEEIVDLYEYSIQFHDDNTCTLKDRQDNILVGKGTYTECNDKLVEVYGEIEVNSGIVLNTLYIWRDQAPSNTEA